MQTPTSFSVSRGRRSSSQRPACPLPPLQLTPAQSTRTRRPSTSHSLRRRRAQNVPACSRPALHPVPLSSCQQSSATNDTPFLKTAGCVSVRRADGRRTHLLHYTNHVRHVHPRTNDTRSPSSLLTSPVYGPQRTNDATNARIERAQRRRRLLKYKRAPARRRLDGRRVHREGHESATPPDLHVRRGCASARPVVTCRLAAAARPRRDAPSGLDMGGAAQSM
ncbi:hypothetical protein DFH06DRAFT_1473580, partial [Mycena polygramma]